MSIPAIRVENLGKKYRIRHKQEGRPYKSLRETITAQIGRLIESQPGASSPESEEFWALRDVSFEIAQGEAVGIIGRNGAGKSTLLKLLSRITEPTQGRIELDGRVASLLEVGTGFHPELTGRENIYLNGAILGMSGNEIRRNFDEIVSFAEVEKFLDTPVKRYSSGMYMRLAFSVAAHLNPEILIVDEVLAVGDIEFQKKCLGKMENVSKSGRTVLFVSHNMDAVMRLCARAICLQKGRIFESGPVNIVVSRYTASHAEQAATISFSELPSAEHVRKNIVLLQVEWPESSPHPPWTLPFGEAISFSAVVECRKPVSHVELGIALYAPTGTEIVSTSSLKAYPSLNLQPGRHRFDIFYHSLLLAPNNYGFGIGIKSNAGMEDWFPKAFSLDIFPSERSSEGKVDTFAGYIVPDVKYVVS